MDKNTKKDNILYKINEIKRLFSAIFNKFRNEDSLNVYLDDIMRHELESFLKESDINNVDIIDITVFPIQGKVIVIGNFIIDTEYINIRLH